MKPLVEAERVWRLLNGIICVYKPPQVSPAYVQYKIRANLCKDLNNMETRPVKEYLEVVTNGSEVVTNFRPSYADSVLCVGPRYQPKDINVDILFNMGPLTSGVLLLAINGGDRISKVLKKINATRCYRLKGILGQATSNYHIEGKVLARAKYDNVDFQSFQKILSFYQSNAQRRAFEEYGFDLTSEEAYEFATKGLYRPDRRGAPIIYNLRLVEFKPPNFEIEVQCIHDTQLYLMNLIHNLGVILKSYATCTGLRCIRHGYFNVEHALLKKYWTADHIIENIKRSYKILQEDYPAKLMFSSTVSLKNSAAEYSYKGYPDHMKYLRDWKPESRGFLLKCKKINRKKIEDFI